MKPGIWELRCILEDVASRSTKWCKLVSLACNYCCQKYKNNIYTMLFMSDPSKISYVVAKMFTHWFGNLMGLFLVDLYLESLFLDIKVPRRTTPNTTLKSRSAGATVACRTNYCSKHYWRVVKICY